MDIIKGIMIEEGKCLNCNNKIYITDCHFQCPYCGYAENWSEQPTYQLDKEEINGNMPTKSGMMVGLGETKDEILRTMEDLRNISCDLLTIGQYLRPSKKHHPLIRFYHPDEFAQLKELGLEMGFKHVASGPLVRSSYHADEQHDAVLDKLLQKPSSQP